MKIQEKLMILVNPLLTEIQATRGMIYKNSRGDECTTMPYGDYPIIQVVFGYRQYPPNTIIFQ